VYRPEFGKLLVRQFRAVLIKDDGLFFRFPDFRNLLRSQPAPSRMPY
jgi:hypothetical protein